MGFFQGKVKHSNEFLVFLGDTYFVTRTAHECQPIISRRLDKLQSELSKLQGHVLKGQEMLGVIGEEFSTQGDVEDASGTRWNKEGLLDIREEVDEEDKSASARPGAAEEEEDDGMDDDLET